MNEKTFSAERIDQFFREVAFEKDEDVFMTRLQQALDEGMDMSAPAPPFRTGTNRQLTVFEALVNVADSRPALDIIRQFCDPLDGHLHKAMKIDSRAAFHFLQVAVENNRAAPGGAGVFEHVLQGPMSLLTPLLLMVAAEDGASTEPPEGSNWFLVLAQNPRAFPRENASQLPEADWERSWNVVDALLRLGFDPCLPLCATARTSEAMRALMDNAVVEPPSEVRNKLKSGFEAMHLDIATPATSAAHPQRSRRM